MNRYDYFVKRRKFERKHFPRIVKGCYSCEEELPFNDCAESTKACGHHDNYSFTHDQCSTCGEEFDIENACVECGCFISDNEQNVCMQCD